MAENLPRLMKNTEPQIKEPGIKKKKKPWVGRTQREFYLDISAIITDVSRGSVGP